MKAAVIRRRFLDGVAQQRSIGPDGIEGFGVQQEGGERDAHLLPRGARAGGEQQHGERVDLVVGQAMGLTLLVLELGFGQGLSLNINAATDIVRAVPSLKMNAYSSSQVVFNIRGVSAASLRRRLPSHGHLRRREVANAIGARHLDHVGPDGQRKAACQAKIPAVSTTSQPA